MTVPRRFKNIIRAGGGPGPAMQLTPANGFTSTHDGQVIHGLDIWCDTRPIVIMHKVRMTHCRIRFRGNLAMLVLPGSDGSVFKFLDVAHASPPSDLSTYPSPPDATTLEELIASQEPPPVGIGGFSYDIGLYPDDIPFNAMQMFVQANECTNLKFHAIRMKNCSTGIKLVGCTYARLTRIYAERMRGPFYCGPSVQFAEGSNYGLLQDFHFYNPIEDSWVEDNLSIYYSNHVTVRRGLIEGNNAPLGVGVMCETAQNCLIEDVDCVDMGNGAFSSYAWYQLSPSTPDPGVEGYGHSNTFRRCRARDPHWRSERNIPASGMLFHAYKGDASTTYGIRFEDCKYWNPSPEAGVSLGEPGSEVVIPGVLVAEDGALEYYDITEEDFTPRTVSAINFPWDDYTGGPFMLALNTGPGQYRPEVDDDIAVATQIGVLRAESHEPTETFTYSLYAAAPDFEIYDSNKVRTAGALAWDDATRYEDNEGTHAAVYVPVRVTGSRGPTYDRLCPVDLLPVNSIGVDTTLGAVVGDIDTTGRLPNGWTCIKDAEMTVEVDSLTDIAPFEVISIKLTATRPVSGAYPRVVEAQLYFPDGIGGTGPAADGDVWRIRADIARKSTETLKLRNSGVTLIEYDSGNISQSDHIYGVGLQFNSTDLRHINSRIGGDVTLDGGGTVRSVSGQFYFDFAWADGEASTPKSQTILIGSPRLIPISGASVLTDPTIFNGQRAGAVVGVIGSGGALPTGWATSLGANVTLEVISIDTTEGVQNFVLDITASAAAGTSAAEIFFPTAYGATAGTLGDVITAEACIKKISETNNGLSGQSLTIYEIDAGYGFLAEYKNQFGIPFGNPTYVAGYRKVSHTVVNALTTYVSGGMFFQLDNAGGATTVRVRIAAKFTVV